MFVDIIIMYLILKYLVMSENCQEEAFWEGAIFETFLVSNAHTAQHLDSKIEI